MNCAGDDMLIVISGPRGAGKSSLAYSILMPLKKCGIACGGVLTLGQEKKRFFCVQDQKSYPFEIEGEPDPIHVGKYRISQSALQFANRAIANGIKQEVLFIDEIGILESQQGGLYEATMAALRSSKKAIILVVRQEIIGLFETLFGVQPDQIAIVEPQKWEHLAECLVRDIISMLSA
jgi:nucleoside-triphosphatase THEP1